MQKPEATRTATLLITALSIVALTIPPVVALWFIYTFGVDTLVLDDFTFVPLFANFADGTLTLSDFTKPHNEHRFFFGRFVILALGLLTHWNHLAEMYASWAFIAGAGVILFCLFVHLFGLRPRTLAMFVPVSFLLFSLKAYEVFLYGIILSNSMMILFALLSVFLFYRSQNRKDYWTLWCASILSAVVSTFAGSGGGLIVWPVGLLQLAAMWRNAGSEQKRPWRKIVAVWILAASVSFFLYFLGYSTYSRSALTLGFADLLNRFLNYAQILFGTPFVSDQQHAPIVGSCVLVIFVLAGLGSIWKVFFGRKDAEFVPVACVVLFGLLELMTIVCFRATQFESGQGASPRYAQFVNVGLIGIYIAVLYFLVKAQARNWATYMALLVVLVLTTTSTLAGYKGAYGTGMILRDRHNQYAYHLLNFELQSDATMWDLCPDPFKRTRSRCSQLKKLGLSVFSYKQVDDRQLPVVEGHVKGVIDAVNQTQVKEPSQILELDQNASETFWLSGWAFDPVSKENVRKLTVLIDGKEPLPTCYGLRREDISGRFRSKSLEDCGFMLTCRADLLPVGRHELSLRAVSSDGTCVSLTAPLLVIDIKRPGG